MNPEQHADRIIDYLEKQGVVGAVFPQEASGAHDRYQPYVVEATYGWAGSQCATTRLRFRVKDPSNRDEVNRSQNGLHITTTKSAVWGPGWEDVLIEREATLDRNLSEEVREVDRFHVRVTITDEPQQHGWFIRRIRVENLRQAGGWLFALRIRDFGVAEFRQIRARGSRDDRCTRGRGLIGTTTGDIVNFTPFALLPEPRRHAVQGPTLSDAVSDGLITEKSASLLENNQITNLLQFQADSFTAIRNWQNSKTERPCAILLTAGTGGGKTEAFAVPLFESIDADQPHPGIHGIFVYPMKALAADQAKRFFEYLYTLNQMRQYPISIGVYDGDTPFQQEDVIVAERDGHSLQTPFSECPGCGGEIRFALSASGQALSMPQCMGCGNTFAWLRMTKREIDTRWPHILLTIPDMLHKAISDKFAWSRQCWLGRPVHWCGKCGIYTPSSTATADGRKTCECGERLAEAISVAPKQLVFDEAHMYKGLFGSQVAVLIGRVRTICEWYGHKPLLIGASATIAVPNVFGRQLFGCEVQIVEGVQEDSEDPPQRYHLFVMPGRVSVLNAIGHILGGCFIADILAGEENRVLVFSDSKRTVYQLEASLNEFYATLFDTVLDREAGPPSTRSHTGDHSRQERRVVESAFDRRELRVLLATQTLEVGVDFDALPLEIQVGATYSYNDYIQRVGRAGRKNTQALVICVLRPQVPLDGYYFDHCRELVRFSPDALEDVPLRSDNPFVVQRHTPAAVLDYLIGLAPNARLVWRTEEAIQELTNNRGEVLDALSRVFIHSHSEDIDLITAAIEAGINKCVAVLSDPALQGKTLERLQEVIELTIRTQDTPVDVDMRDFEEYEGVSLAGELDGDDATNVETEDMEDPTE